MRLIDADALIKQLKSSPAYNDYEWAMYADGFIEDIENVPSIDIEPKRGEWIYDMNQYYKCTNCGHSTLIPDSGSVFVPDWDEYHFCPNCGADMREREGE